MSAEQYWSLSPEDRKRANDMFSDEFYQREPTEDDWKSVRELYAGGTKPRHICPILDLKSPKSKAAVRKFIKTLDPPKPLTADEIFDREMKGRIKR